MIFCWFVVIKLLLLPLHLSPPVLSQETWRVHQSSAAFHLMAVCTSWSGTPPPPASCPRHRETTARWRTLRRVRLTSLACMVLMINVLQDQEDEKALFGDMLQFKKKKKMLNWHFPVFNMHFGWSHQINGKTLKQMCNLPKCFYTWLWCV